jgi:hypothetical protein
MSADGLGLGQMTIHKPECLIWSTGEVVDNVHLKLLLKLYDPLDTSQILDNVCFPQKNHNSRPDQ